MGLIAKIKAEVEKKTHGEQGYSSGDAECGYRDCARDILSFLNTIEVKEVDLEEEIDKIWNPRFNLGWNEKSLLSMNHEGFTTIAKYFYELGLKAKGE